MADSKDILIQYYERKIENLEKEISRLQKEKSELYGYYNYLNKLLSRRPSNFDQISERRQEYAKEISRKTKEIDFRQRELNNTKDELKKYKDYSPFDIKRKVKDRARPYKKKYDNAKERFEEADRKTTVGKARQRTKRYKNIIEEHNNAEKKLNEEHKQATESIGLWSERLKELDEILRNNYDNLTRKQIQDIQQQQQLINQNLRGAEEERKKKEEELKEIQEEKEKFDNAQKEEEGLLKKTGRPLTQPFRATGNSIKQGWQNRQQKKEEKRQRKQQKKEDKKKETLGQTWERWKHTTEAISNAAKGAKNLWGATQKLGKRRMADLFILLAVVVHLMKFGLGFNVAQTWILDAVFALFVWIVIYEDSDKNTRGIRALLIVLALEIVLPLVVGKFDALATNKYVHYYFANRLLTPWWFYFAIIWANNASEPSRIAKLIKVVVVLFWIGVLLGSLPAVTFSKMSPADYMGQQQTDRAIDFYQKSKAFWFEDVAGAIKRGGASIFDAWEKQMAAATGGYYTGMVDRNSDKKLGVYIEKVQPTSPEFFYDSPVSVQGNIEIMSLADSVLLNVSCYHGGKGEYGSFDEAKRATEVYPEKARWYYNREREQVDCMFEPGYLPRGSHKITVTSGFNFETMAYQKAYFMQKERMRALIGQGKDPLSEYGIKDKEPKAKYTAGPVMIGMEVSNLPVSVSEDKNNRPSIGVTLESNTGWKGRIKQLKELVIEVPDSMSIDTDSCNYELEKAKEGNKEEIVEGFREERTKEFEECIEETGISKESIGEEGYVSHHPTADPEAFNKCLQEKAEEKMKNKGSVNELVEGYKKYRSSQFRDCLEQTSLTNDMFNNEGYIKKEYSGTTDTQGFQQCLKDYAKEETEGYNLYYLDLDKYPEEFKNIERYKTFSCRLNIDKPQEILGNRPIATHYLRAKARYDYQLEKSTRVQVIGGGAPEPYDLPEGLPSQHMQIRRDYGDMIQDSINKVTQEDVFEENVGEVLSQCAIQAQIIHESGGDPKKINNDDPSYGLMQVMKPTKREVVNKLKKEDIEHSNNPDLLNAQDNILIGTYYLAEQINKALERGASKEDALKYALAQYNHGPGDVWDDCASGGKYDSFDICHGRLPDITQKYVTAIPESTNACEEEGYDKKQENPEGDEWNSNKWKSGQFKFKAKYDEGDIDGIIEYWQTHKPESNITDKKDEVKELVYNENKLDKEREKSSTVHCITINNDPEQCSGSGSYDLQDYYKEENGEYKKTDEYWNLYTKVHSALRIKRDYYPKTSEESKGPGKLNLTVPSQRYDPEDKKVRAKLKFNDLIEMGQQEFAKTDKWSNFRRSPFVKVKFTGCEPAKNAFECTLEYRFAGNFIENSGKLGHDEKRSFNSLLDIRFDDDWDATHSIDLLNKNGREICSVEWPVYSKPKKCISEDYPYGLGITIRDNFDERVDKSLRENNANVQVEYNIKDFKANCCSNPKGCGSFSLGTCNKDEAKDKDCKISRRGEKSFVCKDLMREVHSS